MMTTLGNAMLCVHYAKIPGAVSKDPRISHTPASEIVDAYDNFTAN